MIVKLPLIHGTNVNSYTTYYLLNFKLQCLKNKFKYMSDSIELESDIILWWLYEYYDIIIKIFERRVLLNWNLPIYT